MSDRYTNLVIDLNKSPKTSLVNSVTSITSVSMPALIQSDTMNLFIQFSRNGVLDTTVNGNPNYTLKTAIGEAGGYEYCNSTNYIPTGSLGFIGSMVTNTVQLSQSMIPNQDYTTFLFELELVNGITSERSTPLQVPITVYREVLSSAPITLDTGSYYTNTQIDAMISASMISSSYARTSSVATTEAAHWVYYPSNNSIQTKWGSEKVGIGGDPVAAGADFLVRDPSGNAVFRMDAPNGLTQFYLASREYPVEPIYFDFAHGSTYAGRIYVYDNLMSLYVKKDNSGYFNILTTSQSLDIERFRITNRGYVGINTTDPQTHLHVFGNVSASNFMGPLIGTASYAINGGSAAVTYPASASYASASLSSSYSYRSKFAESSSYSLVTNTYNVISQSFKVYELSSSFASSSVSSSNAVSASYVYNSITSNRAISASYAETASHGTNFRISQGGRLEWCSNDINVPTVIYYSTASSKLVVKDADGLNPDADLVQSLGDSTHRWNNIYANNFVGTSSVALTASFAMNGVGGSTANSSSWASSSVSSSHALYADQAGVSQYANQSVAAFTLNKDGGGSEGGQFTMMGGENQYGLWAIDMYNKTMRYYYASGSYVVAQFVLVPTSSLGSYSEFYSSLIPNNIYGPCDLGFDNTNEWRNIYFSGKAYGTSSYADTASFALNVTPVISCSWASASISSSYSINSITASFATTSSYSITNTYNITSSIVSSSYSATSSYYQFPATSSQGVAWRIYGEPGGRLIFKYGS